MKVSEKIKSAIEVSEIDRMCRPNAIMLGHGTLRSLISEFNLDHGLEQTCATSLKKYEGLDVIINREKELSIMLCYEEE